MTNDPLPPKNRTLAQNRAMHKYFQEVATELNNQGISHRDFWSNIEADFTAESLKDLFRAFANKKYGRTSTADMTTKEVVECYEEVNRHISQFGVEIPWPSIENTKSYLNSFNQ